MTTVVDPGGTPAPTYNRSGVTVQDVTAAGTSSGTATQLTHYSEWDVFVVLRPDGSHNGVILPSDADNGDVVELHAAFASVGNITVYAPLGTTIENGSSTSVGVNSPVLVRLIGSDWRFIVAP